MPERGQPLVFLAFFAESEENVNPSTTEFIKRLVQVGRDLWAIEEDYTS
jgi:hypothetical protein